MGDDIPFGITKAEYFSVLKDFLANEGDGNDVTDDDIRQAHDAGFFKGQDIAHEIEKMVASLIENKKGNEPVMEVDESAQESDAEERRSSSQHKKKKKKKHSKDKKKDRDKDKHRSKEERKEKVKEEKRSDSDEKKKVKIESSSDSEAKHQKKKTIAVNSDSDDNPPIKKKVKMDNSSDSEDQKKKKVKLENSDSDSRRHHHHKKKKEKDRKKVITISSSDSEDDREKKRKEKKEVRFEETDKKDSGIQMKASSSSKDDIVEVIRKKSPERKPEPKEFSKYVSFAAKTPLKRWKPVLHRDHLKYQRKFKLTPLSIVCVDLLDFPMVFHAPGKSKHNRNPNSMPLKSGAECDESTLELLRRLERDKRSWFQKKQARQVKRIFRGNQRSHDDDRRHKKRLESSSDSSVARYNSKKARHDNDHRDKSSHRKSGKGDYQSKMEELKRKVKAQVEQKLKAPPLPSKPTRELPKQKDALDKKKRLTKLPETKNLPATAFQKILKQIETANKEQAKKPKIELKIPKKNQGDDNKPIPISEYKISDKIGVNDVSKEVRNLLCRNVLVDCPVMPTEMDGLGEYTVKKIAWWILKNEKDPPVEGAFHPEFHDDDELESRHEDDFEWGSDVSSINGCVSDPEGTGAELPPDPKKVADPDWADDYCGEASLFAKFRRETEETRGKTFPIDSMEPFKSFLRTKPGTNYSKPSFEVKCFLCNELLSGQRQFGAHIRSERHKNSFRNYSLELANYEEKIVQPTPRKVFTAKLMDYADKAAGGPSVNGKKDLQDETKLDIGKIEHVRSDSPGPIVGGDAAPNIETHQAQIPDDMLSLPSIEDYDISSDESLMNVRVALRTSSKWNDDLEKRWRTWKDEEQKLAEGYEADRECFINYPEKYPGYQEEWMKFWEQRCNELEAEGKDTENYDFQKEWMPFWLKRMQELMQAKAENQNAELKRRLGIDKHTLRRRFGISPEATKRKKQKRKVKNLVEQYPPSSMKSLETLKIEDRGPSTPQFAQSHEQYKPYSKSACDETGNPSVPDGDIARISEHVNERQAEKELHRQKSHSDKDRHKEKDRQRDRHDDRSKSHKVRHGKNEDAEERRHKDRHRDRGRDRERDHISGRHHDDRRKRSRSPYKSKTKKSASPTSSAEPPPPGEEAQTSRVSKATKPPPPVISEKVSQQALELNKRIDESLKEKLGDKSKESRHPENVTSSTRSASSNEERPSKIARKDSRASDISSSFSEQDLHERALKIREALANTFHTKPDSPSQRPKVIPLEKTKKSGNLSDGEVASDVSELSINQGMSSFLNKQIPGLDNLSSAHHGQTSGHHSNDRKKTDDHRHPSSDRPRFEKKDKHKRHHKGDRHEKPRHHSSSHDNRRPRSDSRPGKDRTPRSDAPANGVGMDVDYRNPNMNFNSVTPNGQSPHQNIPRLNPNFIPVGPRQEPWAEDTWGALQQSQIPVVGPNSHQQYRQPFAPNQQSPWNNPGNWGPQYPPNNYYNNY